MTPDRVDLSLHRVETALAGQELVVPRLPLSKIAAVAIVLRYQNGGPEVLLMRRIERDGDPWSGQISLPGGSGKDADGDAVGTAIRETQEEVGLDLAVCARRIGFLPPVHPVPRGLARPLHVTPVVFTQIRDDPTAAGDEAQRVFWFPLDRAAAGELDGTTHWKIGFIDKQFPCWNFDGEVVWGMTHRILLSLLKTTRNGGQS